MFLGVLVRALLEALYEHYFNSYAKVLILLRIWHLGECFVCVFLCFLAASWAGCLAELAGWLAGLAGLLASWLPACLAGWLVSWRRECSMCICFCVGFIRLIEMLLVCLWSCLQRVYYLHVFLEDGL